MSSEAELIVDRRRLRRKVTFWRVAAILFAIAGLAALLWTPGNFDQYRDHIARIRITGLITGDQRTLNLVEQVEKSKQAEALIVRIDSPGGTTAGSEALYEALRKVAAKKPVVAVMDTVAASGGYITALAADHIVARGNTITGSIGVIFSFPEVSALLDKLGIKMEEIKSGELKAEPSPYRPVSDKVRAVANELVQEGFTWFIGLVAERRSIPLDQVKVLADGRVYTGRQAVANKLIDELGGEDQALAWLVKAKHIDAKTKVVEWKLPPNTDLTGLGFQITDFILKALGFDGLRQQVESAKLDGLLVLWHPEL
jgi:protease-4